MQITPFLDITHIHNFGISFGLFSNTIPAVYLIIIALFVVFFIIYLLLFFHAIGLNNLIYEKDVIKKPNIVLAFVFIILNTSFEINYISILISFLLLSKNCLISLK